MPNIAAVLKQEIVRLSTKAARRHVAPLRSSSIAQRRTIADLRKQVDELGRQVAVLRRAAAKAPVSASAEEGAQGRFVAKGLISLRKRLGLSAKEFGRLVGVSGLSIYNWEHKKTRPRPALQAKIAGLRTLGKREAKARLEMLGSSHGAAKKHVRPKTAND